jgi:hypothetical protein
MLLLPPNVAVQLIEGSLPWDRSTQLHIDTFLRLYSLHDSDWIGIHVNCGWQDAAIAVIRFDPVWNSSVSAPTSLVADWPLLFLRFNCVNTIRLSGFKENGNLQRGISSVSVESVSDEEAVTIISDHDGGLVSIQHFPLIDALAMSASEGVLNLPGCSV